MASNLVKTNHLEYSLFELVDDAIIISDKHDSILFTNNKVEQLFGYKYEDFLAQSNGKFVSYFFDRLNTKILVLQSNKEQNGHPKKSSWEKELITKAGKSIRTKWTRSLLDDGNVIHTIQDVSSLKHLTKLTG